jgi:tricorn protease
VSDALDRLGGKADRLQAIFITVDPKRDTPAAVKQYVAAFTPRLIGLTGSDEQIAKVAQEYRVYYAEHRTGSGPNDYTMDHSSVLYLMGPDGKFIAFSAEYAGNVDVYVVPADGGEPKRLTWHPGNDFVQGWTPDGKAIMFSSSRASWAPSGAPRFWTVPADGGVEQPMALPRGYQGKISSDGTRIAYRMNNSWDEERRNYRGGQNRPIWIVDLKTFDLVSPPWTDSKDMDPVWVGDSVYFISDRDGVANVWTYETKGKKLAQVTKFRDFDVKTLDAGAGAVGFEQAGYIHELDPKSGREHVVKVTAAGDFPWMMSHWEDVSSRLTNMAISPTGKRITDIDVRINNASLSARPNSNGS